MRKLAIMGLMCWTLFTSVAYGQLQVKTANGIVEGVLEKSGVRSFKGIPFAAPPVGELRWAAPQPVRSWTGVRKADHFAAMGVQPPIYSDMVFRADGKNEDCLYLNVWAPPGGGKNLPVLLYFFGGGFIAGDGSENRYDGESMATKGIVSVTITYRVGVFGFLSHPDLTKESPHHASGNYGLLDQSAALHWVRENIKAFGGDPNRITIAGESAGSTSVCAQMASPLSRGLIAGAIGESGSILGGTPVTLYSAEQIGVKFAQSCGVNSIAELRAMPADKVLEAAGKFSGYRFPACIDGYFLPKAPVAIFKAGEQAHVPLLAGWNSDEGSYKSIVGNDAPATKENYEKGVRKLYGAGADSVLQLYPVATDADVEQVGTELANDRGIAFNTWRWLDMQSQTGGKPVYRYFFERARPEAKPARGAVHSAEIEYALGDLSLNKVYSWTADDFAISKTMQEYFANFIKNGNPNGPGLPEWQAVKSGVPASVMHINVQTRAETETHRDRYLHWEGRAAL
ncbi:MAG: carboxylesterase family protein [Bacteroidetes bacterium]|nr:carboxylesterase family protein [Bacteroidota bacterium]